MTNDEVSKHFIGLGYKAENQSGVVMVFVDEKDYSNRKKFEKIVKGLIDMRLVIIITIP